MTIDKATAFNKIHRILNGSDWSPDTLDEIAEVVKETGKNIYGPDYDFRAEYWFLGATLSFEIVLGDDGEPVVKSVVVVPYQEDLEYNYTKLDSREGKRGEVTSDYPRMGWTSNEVNEALYAYMDEHRLPLTSQEIDGIPERLRSYLYALEWEG